MYSSKPAYRSPYERILPPHGTPSCTARSKSVLPKPPRWSWTTVGAAIENAYQSSQASNPEFQFRPQSPGSFVLADPVRMKLELPTTWGVSGPLFGSTSERARNDDLLTAFTLSV